MNLKRILFVTVAIVIAILSYSLPKRFIGHSIEDRSFGDLIKFQREIQANPEVIEILREKLLALLGERKEVAIDSKIFFTFVASDLPGQEKVIFNEFSQKDKNFVDFWHHSIHLLAKRDAGDGFKLIVWSDGLNGINDNGSEDDILVSVFFAIEK